MVNKRLTQKFMPKPHKVVPIGNMGSDADLILPNKSGHQRNNLIFDKGGMCYGEIWVMGNATADTIATATLSQMTRFANNGESNNTTPDHTNDHITILKKGKYLVIISLAFKGDASVEWDFRLYTNNRATAFNNVHTDRKLGAGGDVGSASLSGICDFAVNDTVELWMKHEAGVNKDITVEDCTLSIVQIGG